MLSSHAYYAFEVNLLFSNYAQNFFSTQTKYPIVLKHDRNRNIKIILNGGPRIIITFSHGEGFEASLLFSLV